jgi:Tol biopolymer transport system component
MIAIVSNRSGALELWVVDINGSNLHKLTSCDVFLRYHFWAKPSH